eukprot:11044384-Ditylum_brightwellii.AAC.1
MEAFVRAGYEGFSLVDLNKWRTYLQTTTLSNIVIGGGKKVTNQFLSRVRGNKKVGYEWAYQTYSSKKL